jgi:hypothetical protein
MGPEALRPKTDILPLSPRRRNFVSPFPQPHSGDILKRRALQEFRKGRKMVSSSPLAVSLRMGDGIGELSSLLAELNV